jgi:predicted MPP superfamily phosphohydrolase
MHSTLARHLRDTGHPSNLLNTGLAGRLEQLADRWARNFGTRAEEYSLSDGIARRALNRKSLRARIEITAHCVPLPDLPRTLEGLRIVQLTDIHHGLYLPFEAVLEAVEMANSLDPDVVALTGDFVTYSRNYIAPVAAMLGALRARHGVYAVLGNHDFRVGADLLTRALRHAGIGVLRNRHTLLHRGGDALVLAGVDDLLYGADLPRALRGARRGVPTILLSHNPRIIRRAAAHGVSLVLSGHTHGGQVRLPLVGSVFGRAPERRRFTAGWDRVGATRIYVSRGIGTVVLPLRYRCHAEIPHLTLESAPDTVASHFP